MPATPISVIASHAVQLNVSNTVVLTQQHAQIILKPLARKHAKHFLNICLQLLQSTPSLQMIAKAGSTKPVQRHCCTSNLQGASGRCSAEDHTLGQHAPAQCTARTHGHWQRRVCVTQKANTRLENPAPNYTPRDLLLHESPTYASKVLAMQPALEQQQ